MSSEESVTATLQVDEIGASKGTNDSHLNTGDTDVEVSFKELTWVPDDDEPAPIRIQGSAWNGDGLGVGGVSILVPGELRDEFADKIRVGGDDE